MAAILNTLKTKFAERLIAFESLSHHLKAGKKLQNVDIFSYLHLW